MVARSVTIIGPGAIGAAVGASLIDSGHDVSFASRTPFEVLDVTHPDGRVLQEIDCVSDPAAATISDTVMLAVKAHHTEAARPFLDAIVHAGTTLFVLQNGVEHIERLAPLVPAGVDIVPVVIALPAVRSAPGVVRTERQGLLSVPNSLGGKLLEELFVDSFIVAEAVDDWITAAWRKLLTNAASGGIGTLSRSDNRVLAADPDGRQLTLELMLEVAMVARAEGADLPDELAELMLDGLLENAGRHVASIVADRLAGAPTEWDARNAVINRIASRHGIDVPINKMITTLIRLGEPIEDGAP